MAALWNGAMRDETNLNEDSFACAAGERGSRAKRGGWYLTGRLSPDEPIRNVPINASPFLVGRRADASLSLACRTVSNRHAELIDNGETLLLRDLKSTNGTYVNGRRVENEVSVAPNDLIQVGSVALRVGYRRPVSNRETACQDVMDEAMALVQFERLMDGSGLVPHYQVIVGCGDGREIGYEVLARSRLVGLQTAGSMFSAADRLDQTAQLSRIVRRCAVQEIRGLSSPPHLFLNTHPVELNSPELLDSLRELRQAAGNQELTLEIHENAIARPQAMVELRAALRDLNVGLAFDDFGVGQARLDHLPTVHPDYLKFDLSLVRSIHRASPEHQQMVANLVRMVGEMGIVSLAEGVETKEDHETCTQMGFQLAQGFFFGRPVPCRKIWPEVKDEAR